MRFGNFFQFLSNQGCKPAKFLKKFSWGVRTLEQDISSAQNRGTRASYFKGLVRDPIRFTQKFGLNRFCAVVFVYKDAIDNMLGLFRDQNQ